MHHDSMLDIIPSLRDSAVMVNGDARMTPNPRLTPMPTDSDRWTVDLIPSIADARRRSVPVLPSLSAARAQPAPRQTPVPVPELPPLAARAMRGSEPPATKSAPALPSLAGVARVRSYLLDD